MARLFRARERSERLVIFGDYDVDGVTATALLTEALRALGWTVDFYLPHRMDEGYGLSPGFIAGLDERKLPFVGEVPKTLSCLAVNRYGKRPDEKVKGRHAEAVVRSGSLFRSQPWQIVRLPRQTMQDQAAEAQKILNNYGFLPEQNVVAPSYWFSYVYQAIAVTYTNQYGRFSVLDDLCGYSFGATAAGTGQPTPLAATAEASLFGTSNGIPPTAGVNLINDLAPGGPKEVYQRFEERMRIGVELRNQYVLGYSPNYVENDGKYRKIRVELSPSKLASFITPLIAPLRIAWRHGYYAPGN